MWRADFSSSVVLPSVCVCVCVCVSKNPQLLFDLTPSWLFDQKLLICYLANFWVRKCTYKLYIFQVHCSIESNCFLFKLLITYVLPTIFHLPIFACWLQVAVDQGLHLFPGPLRLSYGTRYARPVWLASPYRTLVQHIPVNHNSHRNPVRGIVFSISVKPSRPSLLFDGYRAWR